MLTAILIAIYVIAALFLFQFSGKTFYESKVAKLLFSGYHTMMLFGFVFSKKSETDYSRKTGRHEQIHVIQYIELFIISAVIVSILMMVGCTRWLFPLPFILFYLLYGIECIISFVHHFFAHGKKSVQDANAKSYRNCAFEMEARANENDPYYLDERKLCAFVRYYGKV